MTSLSYTLLLSLSFSGKRRVDRLRWHRLPPMRSHSCKFRDPVECEMKTRKGVTPFCQTDPCIENPHQVLAGRKQIGNFFIVLRLPFQLRLFLLASLSQYCLCLNPHLPALGSCLTTSPQSYPATRTSHNHHHHHHQ